MVLEKSGNLSISVETANGFPVLKIAGSIQETEVEELEKKLLELVEQTEAPVVVDLSQVIYLTSSALGVFMLAYKRLSERDLELRIVNPQPLIREILQTTKLDRLFRIFKDIDQAVHA